MEPGAELDHAADARTAGDEEITARRPVDAGDDLEERALARAVPADEAERFAVVHLERDGLERPEFFDALAARAVEQPQHLELELGRGIVPQVEPLREVARFDEE